MVKITGINAININNNEPLSIRDIWVSLIAELSVAKPTGIIDAQNSKYI
jgi:hypothetical protein